VIPVSTSASVCPVELMSSSDGGSWTRPVSGGAGELDEVVLRAARGETKTGGVGGTVPCSEDGFDANGSGSGLLEGAVAAKFALGGGVGSGGSEACDEESEL